MTVHRVVSAALVRDGRVLLGHRSAGRRWYPDEWDLPGGHVEDGEAPEEALVREIAEELGVRVRAPAGTPDAVLDADDLRRLPLAHPGYVGLLTGWLRR